MDSKLIRTVEATIKNLQKQYQFYKSLSMTPDADQSWVGDVVAEALYDALEKIQTIPRSLRTRK